MFIYLFINGIFKEAVSMLDYISTDGIIASEK
jgi:hypothetical protein